MAATPYTPKQFSIQQVFEILLTDTAVTNKVLAYLDDLKTSTLKNTATTVFPSGGRGNSYIGVGFGHSRKATLEIQKATWNSDVIAIQTGNDVVVGTNTDIMKYEILPVTSNAATTAFTALGTVGSEIGTISVLNADGTLNKTLDQALTASSGKYAYAFATKAITTFAGDVPVGGSIAVAYNFSSGTSAQTIKITSDKFGKVVNFKAMAVVKDIATGVDYQAQIIGRGKVDDNFDWALTASGEPAVENFNIEILRPLNSKQLYEIVVYNEADSL